MSQVLFVSPYKLQGFMECPKWYFFEYLDEAVAPYKKELRKPRSFFTVGDCVHKTINKILTVDIKERNLQRSVETLTGIWSTYAGEKGGFIDKNDETKCFSEASEMIKNFSEKQNNIPEPYYTPGTDPTKEMKKSEIEENLILQGKIDRIDKIADDLNVVDYKTGKSEENDTFQIMAYGVLAEGVFKQKVSKVSYWYLRSNHLQSFQYGQNEREDTLKKILKIVEMIRQEKEFCPKVGTRCYICDYVSFCPEKNKVMENTTNNNEKKIGNLPF